MKTLDALMIVIRKRQQRKVPLYQESKPSPQAEMVCEAVDMQLESFRSHLEKEIGLLERRMTKKIEQASAARFDPE